MRVTQVLVFLTTTVISQMVSAKLGRWGLRVFVFCVFTLKDLCKPCKLLLQTATNITWQNSCLLKHLKGANIVTNALLHHRDV